MAEINQNDVRVLLDERLATWNLAQTPPLEIAWENVPLKPVGETWLQPYLLSAGVTSLDLQGKHRLYLGVYQISIISDSRVGPQKPSEIAYKLAQLFPVNLILGTTLKVQVITPVSPGPNIPASTTFTLPVSFQVRADSI